MNPLFTKEMAQQHIGDLRRLARKSRVSDEYRELEDDDGGVTVRPANPGDGDAVRLLAALEGAQMPRGEVLVAEARGEVVAALALDGGPALADPFRPTKHVVAMLELRARQVRADEDVAGHPRFPRLRGVLRAA